MTCTVRAYKYKRDFETLVVPHLQQRQCFDTGTFIQDGTPPYIGVCVQQFPRQRLRNNVAISRAFLIIWLPCSPMCMVFDTKTLRDTKNLDYRRLDVTFAGLKEVYYYECEKYFSRPITIRS